MKTRYILLGLIAVTTLVYASGVMPPYDNSKSPKLPLPAAYQIAVTALGSDSNRLHCVSAGVTTDFGAPRWSFNFYSTNSPAYRVCPTNMLQGWRCMTVDFDGKTQEDFGLR